MSTPTHPPAGEGGGRGHRPSVLIALVVVPVIVAITLAAFAWPAANLAPRDLPLGVTGASTSVAAVEHRLAAQDGAFDVRRYEDEQSARTAIEDREIYGAVVATPDGQTVMTASGASPVVAGALQQALAPPPAGIGAPGPAVVDAVPGDPDDPHGAAFGSLVLPLVLSSIIAGVMVSVLRRPGLVRALVVVGAAVAGSLVAVGMVQGWLGVIEGGWLANAGALCLTMVAIAAFLAGMEALLGHAGLAIAAVLMILVGNPWSAVASAPELLPQPVGGIGQLLPPGAGGNLLRSTAFFDGAGATGHLLVLAAWAAVGLGAIWAGALLARRRSASRARVLAPA